MSVADRNRQSAVETLNKHTAVELARMIRRRDVSPVEVVEAHLKAIDRLNGSLNAIITLVADQAWASAKSAEAAVMQGHSLGILHGLPVVIKDVTKTSFLLLRPIDWTT